MSLLLPLRLKNIKKQNKIILTQTPRNKTETHSLGKEWQCHTQRAMEKRQTDLLETVIISMILDHSLLPFPLEWSTDPKIEEKEASCKHADEHDMIKDDLVLHNESWLISFGLPVVFLKISYLVKSLWCRLLFVLCIPSIRFCNKQVFTLPGYIWIWTYLTLLILYHSSGAKANLS